MNIKQLIDNGALFVCNHSAGKDSQVLYLYLKQIIPKQQLIIIHADLGEVEWPGTLDHIKVTTNHKLFVVKARRTLLQMVAERGMFPSPKYRQCTSDLKRGPINKKIRQYCNEYGFNIVVNCMGLRAQESANRAKQLSFKINKTETNLKRTFYDWLPIHDLLTAEIFEIIAAHNELPHWAYGKGMSRLSCCFCIMASERDLYTASKLNPILFKTYVDLEKTIGQTMMMPSKAKGRRFLDEIVNEFKTNIFEIN